VAEVAGELSDPVVTYRGRGRFLLDYQSVRIGPPAAERLPFRSGGTYLITGGLGGLGLVFAEFLAREYQARLALLGISPLPPREEWEGWITRHGEHDRVSDRIRKVRDLEALGAEVLVLGVDVADEEQMRQAVEQVQARFGPLNGAIHAAGLAGGGLIQLKTPETAARVMSPKVRGTVTLEAVLADQPLDFLLLCSSTIAVAGGLGQVDYCAANSFLDAFAHQKALAGDSRIVSINWGAWQEVGMAVAAGVDKVAAAERYIHPLLDRCTREMAEQTIYETDFTAARQWVLAEHRILGQPTVPGTSYLEMACAAFQDHAAVFERRAGESGVEIREALFLNPLRLEESETRTVQMILEPEGEGFAFRVVSKANKAPQVHARGKVAALAPGTAERRDLEEIRQRCNERELVITEPVMNTGETLVYWGPRWQSLRRVNTGPGEILAFQELPEEFAGDLGKFTLHPALLDVATSLMGFVEEGTHLPISYQRLTLRRPLGTRIYSHLRKRDDGAEARETVAVDVTLMDENGEVLVEIERFVLKQVTETSTLRRPAAAETAAVASPAPEKTPEPSAKVASRVDASDGILSQEGVEAVRRVLSRRGDLPQVVASAKDLHILLAQVRSLTRGNLAGPDPSRAPQRAAHPRPNLTTPYAAPRNPVEQQLAEAFQQALGVEEVGIHDNFFDLGGDSIVGIQVVARANETGLNLSPDQLFENQTIAELAALIVPKQAPMEAPAAELAKVPAQPFADSGLAAEEVDKVLAKLREMNL
jgi:NAD(P)-dependent dehydrogenase (short-subunit alcohol dehydrogenase family)/aryl carrier-like protein